MTNSVNYAVSPAQAEVNTLVEQGLVALEQFRQFNQEQVDFIVAKASVAALDQHGAHRFTRCRGNMARCL